MAAREISDVRPDGQVFGRSTTDKIGFFGVTPVVQQTTAAATSSVATTAINETRINGIITALTALGLVVES